jgi:hypothetical protein
MPRGVTTEEGEKLLALVQERPFLYDPQKRDYKLPDVVANGWVEIARQMGTHALIW